MYNKEKILALAKKISSMGKPKPYFAILQPRRNKEETPAQDFGSQYGGKIPLSCNHTFSFLQVSGMPVDLARNTLLEAAIEKEVKYVLFVGEDTVIPFNAFELLHEQAENNPDAVISGIYYFKAGGPMIIVRDKESRQHLADVTPGKIIENPLLIGLDIMLIPVSILKALKEKDPELPFTCVVQESDDTRFIGEDEFFINRLYETGFRVLVDTRVQCLHMDLVTGNYTAHPSVNLDNYETVIPIGRAFTFKDMDYLTNRWVDRAPKLELEQIEDHG